MLKKGEEKGTGEVMAKRQKTGKAGVTVHVAKNGEKIYYIRYYLEKGGKQYEECAGSSYSGMTAAKAAVLRAAKQAREVPTNAESRTAQAEGEDKKWTLKRLFDTYQDTLAAGEGRKVDSRNFKKWNHLEDREAHEVATEDVERVQKEMETAGKSAQTIKHVLVILDRTINFGVKTGRISQPDTKKLRITKPKVDSGTHIETMDDKQLERYITAINEEEDQISANILRFALVTGMRRTAILSLKWEDIDFNNSNIMLRGIVSKKKKTDYIKINSSARNILEIMQKDGYGGEYVFSKPGGTIRKDFRRLSRRVRNKAGLPKDFRPLHGLRHTFASRLISSRKVNMDELQELLTHETPAMTRVYAKFSDEAKQQAANAADDIMMLNREES